MCFSIILCRSHGPYSYLHLQFLILILIMTDIIATSASLTKKPINKQTPLFTPFQTLFSTVK